jgi:hypothetical protein
MAAKTLPLMFAWVLGLSLALLGVPTASAITFNFNSPSGPLPSTQVYGVPPFNVEAAGFSQPAFAGSLVGATPENLFGKNIVGDPSEQGLGLVNGTDNEIVGNLLIRIALGAGLLPPASFIMASTTGGEAWQVWGSNSATTGFVPLLAGNDQLVEHMLPFFNFYTFQATIGNVLLASMTTALVPSPIVGAGLPGLIVACGCLIALARRRRQRLA